MNIETCANGTQRGKYSGRPTGFRRLSMASLATDYEAQDFVGFGDNGPRPVQILGAFKAAAPYLGFGPRVVHAIDWLSRERRRPPGETGARSARRNGRGSR